MTTAFQDSFSTPIQSGFGPAEDATPLLHWEPIAADESGAGIEGLRRIYADLKDACASLGDEDDVRPAYEVLAGVYEILQRTSYAFDQKNHGNNAQLTFPSGYVAVEEDGGVRIEWWREEKYVHLIVLHDQRQYAFTNVNQADGKIVMDVLPARLAAFLRTLASA